jgi:hypothetical protein
MRFIQLVAVLVAVAMGFGLALAQNQKGPDAPGGAMEAKGNPVVLPRGELDLSGFNPTKTREPETPASPWIEILKAYAITFGWAIVGSVSMGTGIILAMKMTHWVHSEVDEWELIKQGNMPMAIIMASLILALGMVVASVTRIN